MGAAVPLTFKTNQPASFQAQKNLNALRYLNPKGAKEQLATDTALECFLKKQELAPGYFDGAKSWVKSTGAYVAGGTAALTFALGLLGIGAYALGKGGECLLAPDMSCPVSLVPWLGKTLAGAMHRALTSSPYVVLGGASAFCVAGEAASRFTGLNISPVRIVGGGAALFARDRAVGAADWCAGQDARRVAEKAAQSQKCHDDMCKEFCNVFNDLALHLHERYEAADRADDGYALTELKALGDELKEKLPAARDFLKQFGLTSDQISKALKVLEQQLKDLQIDTLALKCGSAKGGRNGALLHHAVNEAEVARLAVPAEIRSRAETAHRDRMSSVWASFTGSASALYTGTKYAIGLTCAGVLGAGAYVFQQGQIPYMSNAAQGIMPEKLPPCISPYAAIGGAFAIGGVSLYQAKKSYDQKQEELAANHALTKKMLDSCLKELKEIYIDVAKHIDGLKDVKKQAQLTASLENKMPVIHNEIRELYLGKHATEFLDALKSQDLKRLAALTSDSEEQHWDTCIR